MSQRIRSLITLGVLAALLVVGAGYGWTALTQPFSSSTSRTDAVCNPVDVAAGDEVTPEQVTVSVLNAGSEGGLAGRTSQAFADAGFGVGSLDNAPADAKVKRAVIWTTDRTSPAAQLIASRIGKRIGVRERDSGLPGITVVVGDAFGRLVKGRPSVIAADDTTICSPPPPAG